MYKSFYNLDSRPFDAQPDPLFLWLGEKYNEALTAFRYGVLENKGFLLLTGDAGTGKTTLVNALTRNFDQDVEWAVVSDPGLERLDFYNAIAKGFKVDREFTSKVQFLIQFSNYLHKAHDENKKVLLVIDDCHRLSQDMLEELRLLSNIEKEEAKLINILFVGRRDFDDMLVQPKNRAVRQRLTLQVELVSFNLKETDDYIRHRLKVAGTEEQLFTANAIQIIHRYAKGIPRLINSICDHAMVAGSAQGTRTLDHKLLEGCIQRLNQPVNPSQNDSDGLVDEQSDLQHSGGHSTPASTGGKTAFSGFNPGSVRRWRWVKYGLAGILFVAMGVYFYYPADKSREMARVADEPAIRQPATKEVGQVISSPPVTVLEPQQQVLNMKKDIDLNHPVLEKSDSASDSNARKEAAVQTEPTEGAQTEGIVDQDRALEKIARVQDDAADKNTTPAAEPDAVAKPVPSQQNIAETGVDEEIAAKASRTVPKPAAIQEPSAEDKKAVRPAPMEQKKIVLGLRPDSLVLTDEAAKEYKTFIEKLKNYPRAKLLVMGFVSAETNSPENVKLSKERAMGVQKLLVKSGIDPARIEVKGMGNQKPVAPNTTREGRAKNRRVEVVVVNDGR